MNVLDLSRWQFGITTVCHFILVPLTIGLAPRTALRPSAPEEGNLAIFLGPLVRS